MPTSPSFPDPAALTSVLDAQRALQDFKQSSKPGIWPHLDKVEIVEEMRSRLELPFRVDQTHQPFCGPASIVFELIRKRPLDYVRMMQGLFEEGMFRTQTRRVKASTRLRHASRNLNMAQADWMLMATLRESENLIFPVEPNAPAMVRNLAGMTKSWEMKGWVHEVLGYPEVQYYHAYALRDIKAMQKAGMAIARGGVAFALVTASGLLSQETLLTRADSKAVRSIALPDHWITLLDIMDCPEARSWWSIAQRNIDAKLSFDVYTWAQRMHVEIGQGAFRRFFWGVVIGTP